jgi:site-specific DNA-methyltransferase (adenine-specific)
VTNPIDLRLGRWQDTLADVTTCDAVICDPPYSARTHEGSDAGVQRTSDGGYRQEIGYAWLTPDDVRTFVAAWAPRCTGWMCAMTDDILSPVWRAAFADAGRYDFAPVPILQHRVRMSGDGPGSGAVYLLVSRPREARFMGWGSLPCWYMSRPEHSAVMGAKPLGLMRALVRDYSRPGDLIVDPFCGSGTTALAAASEGRRCITSEELPAHHEIARRRFARGYTPDLF